MTALKDYVRLESTGLWRETAGAQRRDVYVFVGAASIVIADKAEAPLSHWSLPAIERLNTGQRPALYAPSSDTEETLEIDDPQMIEAIRRVQKAVRASEPRPGRLRLLITALLAVGIGALGVFWLPGAVTGHALKVVPDAKRASLGRQLFADMERLTGPACGGTVGVRTLSALGERIKPAAPPALLVVRNGVQGSVMLPGGIILLDRTLIEDFDTADVAAGYVISEMARREATDPLRALLEHAGSFETLRLMTTGNFGPDVLRSYAPELLRGGRPEPATDAMIAGFVEARIASTPFATARAVDLDPRDPLVADDPYRNRAAPIVLEDNRWVEIQTLCTG